MPLLQCLQASPVPLPPRLNAVACITPCVAACRGWSVKLRAIGQPQGLWPSPAAHAPFPLPSSTRTASVPPVPWLTPSLPALLQALGLLETLETLEVPPSPTEVPPQPASAPVKPQPEAQAAAAELAAAQPATEPHFQDGANYDADVESMFASVMTYASLEDVTTALVVDQELAELSFKAAIGNGATAAATAAAPLAVPEATPAAPQEQQKVNSTAASSAASLLKVGMAVVAPEMVLAFALLPLQLWPGLAIATK